MKYSIFRHRSSRGRTGRIGDHGRKAGGDGLHASDGFDLHYGGVHVQIGVVKCFGKLLAGKETE